MPSLRYTMDVIVEALYEHYLETNQKEFNIEGLHAIILKRLTVMPKTTANYIKQMVAMGYIIAIDGKFIVSSRLFDRGKELFLHKNEGHTGRPKEDKPKTNDLGLFKY